MKGRIILRIIAAGVVLVAGYTAFSWMATKRAVKDYCESLVEGTPMEKARVEAKKRGLSFHDSTVGGQQGTQQALVTASGVLGRHVCIIELDNSAVKKAILRFND